MPSRPDQPASANSAPADVRFVAFFLAWADLMGWEVPAIHLRACRWLATCGNLAVFRAFRGFSKSTLLAIYNAWRYHEDPAHRILHQGDKDGTAYKTSRDTKRVLMRHPFTAKLREIRGESAFWWVPGADDERNPSMQAAGITTAITSSRADEIQNDDVEVPRNIQTADAREKMRYRLGEQVHILVPDGRKLFIGTPHTHESIYDEMERLGADCLTIRMFEQEFRVENATKTRYRLTFVPEYVFFGIGPEARLLREKHDYRLHGNEIEFASVPNALIDFYTGCAWPSRFTRAELSKRRKETRTINEWDSQYQLHSKPVTEMRLDPARIIPYDAEPRLHHTNSTTSMWLGKARIAGMSLRWDPASGKLKSDVSAVAMVLQDEQGRRYWHRCIRLTGDVAEFADDGKTIIGGQVWQLCDLVEEFSAPRIVIETNGIGQFAPAVLKAALKQRRLHCGVKDESAVLNKDRRILEAFEPIMSSGMLWGHVSVLDGPTWNQMRDWVPGVPNQPDDYLDAGAGAITETPERIRAQMVGNPTDPSRQDWRPQSGVYEVELEY